MGGLGSSGPSLEEQPLTVNDEADDQADDRPAPDDATADTVSTPEAAPDEQPDDADGADDATAETPAPARRNQVLAIAGIAALVVVVVAVVIIAANNSKTSSTSAASATTWTYQDLQGHKVIVTAGSSGSSRFGSVQGHPLPLAVVAIDVDAVRRGCSALQARYQSWQAGATSAASQHSRDRASAYAEYARDLAREHNCAWALTSG